MIERRCQIHIGTSGWHYDHWKGPFYPPGMASEHFLAYYADHFDTVEVNNTFYQLPAEGTVTAWRETVPSTFTFAVKASRYITHMKKLSDPEASLANFFHCIDLLGDRLGPILFQLPPRWGFDQGRLAAFLQALPAGYRYVFEFRDPSWFNPAAYALLAEHEAAFCMQDMTPEAPKEITADWIYIRMHGPRGDYGGSYRTEELAGWAGALSTWADQGKTIYIYFNNDMAGYAVQDAGELRAMLAG